MGKRLIALLTLIVCAVPAHAVLVDATWLGASGNWNDGLNWSGGVVPDNGVDTFNVLIDAGNGAASSVTLNTIVTIDSLVVDAGDSLTVDNGARLSIESGQVSNAGTILLNSSGGNTYLIPRTGAVTLTGGGTLSLSDATTNWIYQENGGSLINMDNTIRGSGHLGWNGSPTPIENHGTVIADQPTRLEVDTGTEMLTNTGVLRAENGGTLDLQRGSIDNSSGVIEALDGSVVALDAVTVSGGTLQTSGSGVIESISASPRLDGSVTAVSSSGTLRALNGTRLYASGSLVNTGTIELNSTGGNTYFHCENTPLTLSGGGTVVMSDSITNWIYQVGGGSLVNVDNTIRGAGHLGWSGSATPIDNQGTVIADQPTRLEVDVATATLTNSGTMRAESGATLDLHSGDIDNTNGLIEALEGSVVALDAVTISGGTLQSTGSGVLEAVGFTTRLDGINLSGTLRIPNSRAVYTRGTVNNTGTIELSAAASSTYLYVENGQVTLTGGGSVLMSNSSVNWIYGSGGGSLLNQDNTISGGGNLGWPGSPTEIINQGTIIADAPATLTIATASETFDNQGTLIASGVGGIQMSGGFVTSGDITVDAGSSLQRTGLYVQNAGSTMVNGALSASSDIQINAGTLGGSGIVTGDVMNAGSVGPGESAGMLTIDGNFAQSGLGEVFIEIGGNAAVDQDKLEVINTAELDGTLRIAFINGYDPAVGEVFEVMTYADRSGDFASFNTPCLPNGKSLAVNVNSSNVTVSVLGSSLADIDCDCAVSLFDVDAMVLALVDPVAYEAATPNCDGLDAADLNDDGNVDGLDIQVFLDEFLP